MVTTGNHLLPVAFVLTLALFAAGKLASVKYLHGLNGPSVFLRDTL